MLKKDVPPIIGLIIAAPAGFIAGVAFALSVFICLAIITLILRLTHIFV